MKVANKKCADKSVGSEPKNGQRRDEDLKPDYNRVEEYLFCQYGSSETGLKFKICSDTSQNLAINIE
ncbi:hypothetical protein L596_021853 [Steinernema carpocapsae]|uniref:Uncharacterized protein n=1 Tax=Steinernema carpocapsae TaxID=34508 RepID=A0A4U5MK01_STECR|nr:hypothetical protein L596_021853 [Steinernema carpocapsae]